MEVPSNLDQVKDSLSKNLLQQIDELKVRIRNSADDQTSLEAIGFVAKILNQLEQQTCTFDEYEPVLLALTKLASMLHSRLDFQGQLQFIDLTIRCQAQVLSLTPVDHATLPFLLNDLGTSHLSRFQQLGWPEDIDKAIECLSRAVMLTPEASPNMPRWLSSLGDMYQSRFQRIGQLEDIDKATECQTRAVSLLPHGHANVLMLLSNLAYSHWIRYKRLGNPDDVDKAIEYLEKAALLAHEGHVAVPDWLINLSNLHKCRFQRSGELEDLNKATECQKQAISLAPESYTSKPDWLNQLGGLHLMRFNYLSALVDIDKAIECQTQAVSLVLESHPNRPHWLNNLGSSHFSRFKRLGELDDINKAIEYQTKAVELTPDGHADKPARLSNLGHLQHGHFKHTNDPQSLNSSLECFRKSALSPTGSPHLRLLAARQWARISSLYAIPNRENLLAYQTAMDLIPLFVWLGSTLSQRYEELKLIGDLAMEAAAAAILAQEYGLALEWLEKGHPQAIIFNQTLQLRTTLHDLSSANPALAGPLRNVANELLSADSVSATQFNDLHSLERAAQRRRRLAEQYEQLVSQACCLPGFESLLQPKTAPELIRVAQTGPVVVINVHTSRCDALALLPEKNEIMHIPLPNMSHAKATAAHAQIEQLLLHHNIKERGSKGIQKMNETDILEGVLATLWTDVTKPVLESLGYIQHPEVGHLRHITWCSTGPLSYLPLHAAGCYDRPRERLSDFVISSYTPTLHALLSALSSSPDTQSGILAVSQASTPGHGGLPKTVTELACIQKHAGAPFHYTQLDESDATTSAVLDAMEMHSWVHLACHAHQSIDDDDPTMSGFYLRDGTLSLAKISQKAFKNKGLAFLSACRAATSRQKPAEEAMHLASGMVAAGYPSVIATMWPIAEEDAPLIVDSVYGQLLKDGRMEYRDAAKALHVAVGELRLKVGDKAFARWIPFVHIGV